MARIGPYVRKDRSGRSVVVSGYDRTAEPSDAPQWPSRDAAVASSAQAQAHADPFANPAPVQPRRIEDGVGRETREIRAMEAKHRADLSTMKASSGEPQDLKDLFEKHQQERSDLTAIHENTFRAESPEMASRGDEYHVPESEQRRRAMHKQVARAHDMKAYVPAPTPEPEPSRPRLFGRRR